MMKLIELNLEQFEDKKAIVQKLKSMGLPTNKTEHLRAFGIKPLMDRDYEVAIPGVQRIEEADHIEIVDGVVTKAPKKLYIEFQSKTKIDDSHYDQFYYIAHLLSPKVIHIDIEEDCDLKIVQKFTKNSIFTPYRIKLNVHKDVKAAIFEEFLVYAQESLYVYGYDIVLQKDAILKLIQNRVTNFPTFAQIGSHSISCEQNSAFDLFTFDFGEAKTLHNYHVTLDENAAANANHVIFGKKEAKVGNTFHIVNNGKDSRTKQFSRNILKDKAKGIFDGLLIVKNSAKYAAIYQDSKTILLNDGAHMLSKPQMEIYTEFISEATHGSTTGQIDEEALFYLRQRGIAKDDAKEMLVLSFLEEIFEKVGNEEIKRQFIEMFEEA